MIPSAPSLTPLIANAERPETPEAVKERDDSLRQAAKEFEATFVAEMLSYAGFEKALSSRAGFGGEAFSRLLIDSYAAEIAEGGSFGLADKIYNQLKDYRS